MATAANITIKKHDNTTDVIYKIRQPSSGDGAPARWSPDVSGPRGSAPTFETVAAKKGGGSPGRKVSGSLFFPLYRDVNGVSTFVDVARGNISLNFPLSFSETDINEFVATLCNLAGATLTREQFRDGYAAT